jgi:hypothetical protein
MTPVPPAKVEVKVALVPLESVVGVAVKPVMVGDGIAGATVMVTFAVTKVPAALVTVRVKVVVADSRPVVTEIPLLTMPMPLSMDPVPLAKVAVSVVDFPLAREVAAAVKLMMVGEAPTLTVTWAEVEPPVGLRTVSVYVAPACRGPVLTPIPTVTGPMPLSMLPVPLTKTAVKVVLWPALMLVGLAVKLRIDGSGSTVT